MAIGDSIEIAVEGFAPLLVGHGEYAVPCAGRFVEQVFLAAFPVHARGTVVRPAV
jgi:hypothetical protein